MGIYLDNAATSRIDESVFDAMSPYIFEEYGNPSSGHSMGRKARAAIENARRTIADLIGSDPGNIVFTSSATEADNMAIRSALSYHDITNVITSPLEHHAVLNALRHLESKGCITLHYVAHREDGLIDLEHLNDLLSSHNRSFVSLMHVNNETGTMNDIEGIARICHAYSALFHSDTVQSIGNSNVRVDKIPVHFIVASAHKLHGPKGVGFLYAGQMNKVAPLLHGGAQERGKRASTENVAGIVGLAKALEIARQDLDNNTRHILSLKNALIRLLREKIPGVSFNGSSDSVEKSIHTILNTSFPCEQSSAELLFELDQKNIAASGGSACNSGQSQSHVLRALGVRQDLATLRFSFSHYNTLREVQIVAEVLSQIVTPRRKSLSTLTLNTAF